MKTRFLGCLLGLLAAVTPVRAEPAAAPAEAPVDPAAALTAKWEKAPIEELSAEVNRLAGETVARQQAREERSVAMNGAWLDPANTSPEIEALRARLQKLENELSATRQALRAAVDDLPALRAQRQEAERQTRELSGIQNARVLLQALLRARLQANREAIKVDQP